MKKIKLEEVYIDGFGMFNNYHQKDLSLGLTIFFGLNEAGKSTYLTYIKRVLFGFPDKRSRLNLYPPLSGGEHGGRLKIITDNDKKYTIQRYSKSNDVKIISDDGSIYGSSEQPRIYGYANKDIFENIFAFGLTELQDFETLNNEAVKERLYSAGTGSGKVSISEIRKSLDSSSGNLFKSSGSKPEINSLFKEINNINSSLKEIENDMKNFDIFHNQLDDLSDEITEKDLKRNEIRKEQLHVKYLIDTWDDWRTTKESEEKIKQLPIIDDFPEDGLTQLENILESIDELNNNITEKANQINKNKDEILKTQVDETLINNKNKILKLQEGREKFISAEADLPTLKQNLKKSQRELNKSLKEIGHDWDEKKLDEIDYSIPTKETVRKKHNKLKNLNDEIHDIESEIKTVNKNLKETNEKIMKVKEKFDTQEYRDINLKEINQQKKALQSLRMQYLLLKEKETELKGLDEKEDLLNIMKPTRIESQPITVPVWPAYSMIIAGVIALVISIIANNWIIGASIFGFMLITGIIYFILSKQKHPLINMKEMEDKDVKIETRDLTKRRGKLEFEFSQVQQEMLENAQLCGFTKIPDLQMIENTDSELQNIIARSSKLTELKSQLNELNNALKKLKTELTTNKKSLKKLEKAKMKLENEWRTWLTAKGLESDLTPEGVKDIFSTIKTCNKDKEAIEDLNHRINTIQSSIIEYEENLAEVLKNCNRLKEEFDVIIESKMLTEDLEEAIGNKNKFEHLNNSIGTFEKEKADLKENLRNGTMELSELLDEGSAKDEQEFRINVNIWKERKEITNNILQAENNIKRVCGDGELYDIFINELENANIEELNIKIKEIEENLDEIEDNLSDLKEERGKIIKEIEQLERKEEGSSLKMSKALNLQKLQNKAKEWSVYSIAKAFMLRAIEKYEKERQPEVLKESQSFFSKMTLGRYSRIFSPFGETRIYVEDEYGSKKELLELSRGTAEQLYLALRFGFIRDFSKRAESLPIIFDDILVNFDPGRAQAAAESIKELSIDNQVFYFTCHPEVKKLLTNAIPDSKVIEL